MKIVVITPVKNEAWILDRFLSVCSQFADAIVIADQNSTDGSRDIYPKYPKVHLIDNTSTNFNEAERQLLLIKKAREIMPGSKILLALDADEILAANAIHSADWQKMLNSKPGTVLLFEKPDLYLDPNQAIRYSTPWPLGYIDDGVEHQPKKIHSIRIPQPAYAEKLVLNGIKVLHYSMTRMDCQSAKMRFYSMMENILEKNHFLARRSVYKPDYNYIGNGRLESSPKEWFQGWDERGIDMKTIETSPNYWYDEECLILFQKHGYKKFWLDKVWNKDWNKFAKEKSIRLETLIYPPVILNIGLSILDKLYSVYRSTRG